VEKEIGQAGKKYSILHHRHFSVTMGTVFSEIGKIATLKSSQNLVKWP
jgi:hypothetical protein